MEEKESPMIVKHSHSETFTIRKETLWKYSTFILAALWIITLFVAFGGKGTTGSVIAPDPSVPSVPSVADIGVDDDAVMGNADAPVEIIEFSDYQCPFCRKFWVDAYPLIKEQYIDTGKVKLAYRDFPLDSIHPMALPSAMAAECVREKGGDEAYFEMHDKIFGEQSILDGGKIDSPVTTTVSYTNQDLVKWAGQLGYDISSCLESGKYENEVFADQADGGKAGVQGTPAFFINGKLLSGAQPFSAFQAAIESELNA